MLLVVALLSGCIDVTDDDEEPDDAVIRSITHVYDESQVYALAGNLIWYEPLENWIQYYNDSIVPITEDIYFYQYMIWSQPTLLWAKLKIENPDGSISWGSTDWENGNIGNVVTNQGPGFYFQCPTGGYYDLTIYMGDLHSHPIV